MDCSINLCRNVSTAVENLTNNIIPISGNNKNIFQWIISRVRFFIYASNPYEEMFESVDQMPDYHTEVSIKFISKIDYIKTSIFNILQTFPIVLGLIFLEWIILWFKRKPIPQLGDTLASGSMSIFMECFRYIIITLFIPMKYLT